MLELVRNNLEKKCSLNTKQPVLVGVSGGPDSVCLVKVLKDLNYPIIIAHFNHKLRKASDIEADGVALLAKQMGVRFEIGQQDVKAYAKIHHYSIEQAARELRYGYLFKVANEYSAKAVVVGHTADDQVETLLLNFLRGSGLDGLAGMSYLSLPNKWSDQIALARPLLSIWRDQIQQYVNEHRLKVYYDASNKDVKYLRNRVRHQLIPVLEKYNPKIKQNIWKTTEVVRSYQQIFEPILDAAWKNVYQGGGTSYIKLTNHELGKYPEIVRREVFRKAIKSLKPDLDNLDFDTIARVENCFNTQIKPNGCNVLEDVRFRRENFCCYFYSDLYELIDNEYPNIKIDEIIPLDIPGNATLGGIWKIEGRLVNIENIKENEVSHNNDPSSAYIDYNSIKLPLIIRTRQVGDRFQSLGMSNKSMKISDFMINEKVPHIARDTWPLVCSNDNIIWIPNIRIAHEYRVTPETRTILCLKIYKLSV